MEWRRNRKGQMRKIILPLPLYSKSAQMCLTWQLSQTGDVGLFTAVGACPFLMGCVSLEAAVRKFSLPCPGGLLKHSA